MKHIKYPEEWFSKNMLLNGLIYKPFSRVKLTAYRGESEHSGSGMAMYGVGLYSTTKYSYAKKFGTVRRVETDEIPLFPIRFKTSLDFQQWEYDLMKKLDVSKDEFEEMGGVVKVVNDLGFDGVTIGTISDMILVKYPENVEEIKNGKIVNITTVEHGTITVDVAENATIDEIEEAAAELYNNGCTSWGDLESYIEVDSKKLPQLVFQNSTVYQLFDCDEWCSNDSINATSPIAVAVDKEQFAEMLVEDLKNEAIHLSENNKMFFEALDEDSFSFTYNVIQAYLEQRIDFRQVVQINLGYKTN